MTIETIGSKIDRLKTLRDERVQLEKQARALKEQEAPLVDDLINALDKQDTTIGRGKKASASIVPEEIAIVEDYDDFYDYVTKTASPYLLQRRLTQGAVKEILESGESIPGIKLLTNRKLSIRKI